MLKQLKQRRRSEEEGFTLIELMVVVLIMGILMAIAIPTFLATRGSANDAAAKSDATNAFTNEKAYFSDNLAFVTGSATLDSSLPWTSAAPTSTDIKSDAAVWADAVSGTSLVIEALSKSGNCYLIGDSEPTTGTSYVGYAWESNGCPTSAPSVPAATPTAGNSPDASGTFAWYAAW
ncbi:MAG: type IV pilin protein [bacterium]